MPFPKEGEVYEGVVVRVFPNYAILLLEGDYTALLHISEVTDSYIHSFSSYVSVGNIYTVKVIASDEEKQNIKVSRRKVTPEDIRSMGRKKKIINSEKDFAELAKRLPEWIDKEIQKEQ